MAPTQHQRNCYYLSFDISFTYAECEPAQGLPRGRRRGAPSPRPPTPSPTRSRPSRRRSRRSRAKSGAADRAQPRRVRPTAAGAALAGHVGGILAQIEAAESEIAAIAAGRGGRLRTASFPTAGATLMPPAIAGFRASHPGVEVTLAEGEPEEIAPRLRAGEFDLVLLFEFEGVGERLERGLRRFELFDDPLHLALPAGHPLAERKRLAARGSARGVLGPDLGGEPLRPPRRPLLPRRGLRAAVSFESDDYQTVQGLVAAGVGVGLIPQLALSGVRDDIAIRPSPREPGRKVFAATPRGAAVTAAVATMLDVLREARAQHRRDDAELARNGTAPGRGGGGSVVLSVRARRGRRPRPLGAAPGAGAGAPGVPRPGSRATARPTGTPRARGRRCRRPPFPPRSSAAARTGRPA